MVAAAAASGALLAAAIAPIAPVPLRADNFDAFFRARSAALLDKIEKATGKPVTGRELQPLAVESIEANEEEDETDQPEN